MAKGQKRSTREAKKPKKTVLEKAKAAPSSSFTDPSRTGIKPTGKKT